MLTIAKFIICHAYMYLKFRIFIIMCVAYAHTHQDAFLAAKPGGDDEESLFYKVSHFLKPYMYM